MTSTLPFFGKLDGIGDQVVENLLQTLAVGDDPLRCLLSPQLQFDPPAAGLGEEARLEGVGQLDERQLFEEEIDPSRLDLGEIEDVVDQGEEVESAPEDDLGRLHLLRGEIAAAVLGEVTGEDQQAVQGGAQFMRHVGEKIGFVAAGRLQIVRLLLQLRLDRFEFAVVLQDLLPLQFQTLGLLLQLLVAGAQFFLLFLEEEFRRLEGLGLLLQLFIAGRQLLLLHLQLFGLAEGGRGGVPASPGAPGRG